jgi:hypothetical protein
MSRRLSINFKKVLESMVIRVVFYMLPESSNEKIIYLCALCVLSEVSADI